MPGARRTVSLTGVTRVAVLLIAVFLVNLPFVHETLTDREVARSGQEVSATVLDSRAAGDRWFVDYRLPESVDDAGTRFSARVDRGTYERARSSREILVLVVPGKPSANRPAGRIGSPLFAAVAGVADLMLVAGGVLYWRRRRQWRLHGVVGVQPGVVVLRFRGHELTATAPEAWLARAEEGTQVPGSLHLAADHDVLPGRAGPRGLEQLTGAAYVARGTVRDARAGQVHLELEDGWVLLVQTGTHRIRADLRDSAEVRGTLCFTPNT